MVGKGIYKDFRLAANRILSWSFDFDFIAALNGNHHV